MAITSDIRADLVVLISDIEADEMTMLSVINTYKMTVISVFDIGCDGWTEEFSFVIHFKYKLKNFC